ncbi:hypothetical protein [Streptomyces sp. LUP30]|uniref:hypothetical protein n=1 Tax=Streptomyces sp. LUP30 TaxID=1890285 RepID=UPI000A779367|nr:hypothetical protein [Streptomyces sp. LUP30]
MTTTSAPRELPGTAMTDEAYGALRTSAALWVGTSVLITNPFGRVLVQHVDYRDTCLEELGVTATVDHCLAADWIAADSTGAPAAMRFPGEILHVFDGGTWDDDRIGDIRLPPSEITGIPGRPPTCHRTLRPHWLVAAASRHLGQLGEELSSLRQSRAPALLKVFRLRFHAAPQVCSVRTAFLTQAKAQDQRPENRG